MKKKSPTQTPKPGEGFSQDEIEAILREQAQRRAELYPTPEAWQAHEEEMEALAQERNFIDDSHNSMEYFRSLPTEEERFKLEVSKMTLDEVAHMIMFVDTEEDIVKARRVRDIWLELHPDDADEVYQACAVLEKVAYEMGLPSLYGPGKTTK